MQSSPSDTLLQAPAEPAAGAPFRDSMQALTEVPEARPDAFERTMLAEDKLPVVLAVVLVIWVGILLLLFRTERRLAKLEQTAPPVADEL